MRIKIENENNISVNESVTGELHETNTSVGFGTNFWNPAMYVSSGDMNHPIPRQGRYDTLIDGWDTIDGDNDTESQLILGVDTKTPVFYAEAREYGVQIKNCHGGTVNVTGMYLSKALTMIDCSNITVTVDSRYCGKGITLTDCSNIEIVDSNIQYSASAHIHVVRGNNIHIHDNVMSYGCLSESNAGIYLGKSSEFCTVEDNHVSFNGYGNYWTLDGGAIYTENNSSNNIVRHNTVTDCYLGLQDNSGQSSNLFEKNIVVNCEYAFDSTDSAGVGNGNAEYRGNLLINTIDGGPRTESRNQICITI